MENKKKILVLLTQHNDNFAKFLRFITGAEYTHASIATEVDLERFFTFNQEDGFYVERPTKIYTEHKRLRKCRLYSVEVDESIHDNICNIIHDFEVNSTAYKYNLLGLILSFFKMPWNRNNSYFCSQFVAELLKKSGAVIVEKDPSLYLPNDFMDISELELCYNGTLGNLEDNMSLIL